MKNSQLKTFAEYFGDRMPVGKISDRETRTAIVLLYGSLIKAYKPIMDNIEDIRKGLVKGHEGEIEEYSKLITPDPTLSEEENKQRAEKAAAMEECVRIDGDFRVAVEKIYAEECKADIRKIEFPTLYEALADCGFPGLTEDAPLSVVKEIFEDIIKA